MKDPFSSKYTQAAGNTLPRQVGQENTHLGDEIKTTVEFSTCEQALILLQPERRGSPQPSPVIVAADKLAGVLPTKTLLPELLCQIGRGDDIVRADNSLEFCRVEAVHWRGL